MNNITTRIKSIFAVSLLAATMVAGATTPTLQASDNREAFGEAYSYASLVFEVYSAVYDEDGREDAAAHMLEYANAYANDEYRLAIEQAVGQIEWTEEGVEPVLDLITYSSIEYLYSLDDEQLWYSDFGLNLTAFLISLTVGDLDWIVEALEDLAATLGMAPDEIEPFLAPVLTALGDLVSDDDMNTDEILTMLDELELVARSNQ
ncbi:MAG: hypothetical protein IH944_02605 [Armatimonadetes bacterium]|nr:hypothetical protein [Armatimonadota bacterium]